MLRRLEGEKKKPLILLRTVPKRTPARILVVEEETGRLVGDRHIDMVPGVGRIGVRVQYLDYKEVDGVQFPWRVTQTYLTPLLGRFEQTIETIESKAKAPPGAFELK